MDEQEARKTVQTLVKSERNKNTKTLSKLSPASSDTVADWLNVYAKTFPNEPTLSPEQVLLYRGLAERYSAERLHRAFAAAVYESQSGQRGFMPKPGEVCAAAERLDSGKAKPSEADPCCAQCDGTGWEIKKEAGSKLAAVCGCRQKNKGNNAAHHG